MTGWAGGRRSGGGRGAFLAALALVAALLARPALAERDHVELGGRHYMIDLPERAAGAPILLALHGGGGNPAQFARNTGLARPALAEGYAVIWPAGTGRRLLTWNGGYCCGPAAASGVDDLAFLDQVVADAVQRFGLDAGRLYVAGMSNGAILAETYAATRRGKVRAVAGVAGTMDAGRVRVAGPVPLLHIHGTADTQVPFAGGQGSTGLTRTDFAPVAEVIRAFRRPVTAALSESAQVIDPEEDGTRVIETDWTDSHGKVMIRLLTVEGGGHAWPGARRAGRQGGTEDIMANVEILHFFAQHR